MTTKTGEFKTHIRLVEIAANTHLGVLNHGASHEDRGFQQKRHLGFYLGRLVYHPFKIYLGTLGQTALQGEIELPAGVIFLPLTTLDNALNQGRQINTGGICHHLELQLRSLADKGNGPFGILNTGQLHHYLILALAQHNGLSHTELVNTVADNFQGLGYRIFSDAINLLRA